MVGLGFVTAYSALSAILEGIKGHGVALDLSALVFPDQIKGLGRSVGIMASCT